MNPIERVIVLLAVCISIIGYIVERKVIKPWRNRRREQRLARASSIRIARDVEISRRNRAAARNGRRVRKLHIG